MWLLPGDDNGKYPSGNSLWVVGSAEQAIIDPSVTVVATGAPGPIDVVLNSHAHEDHVAGNGSFPDARVRAHVDDLAGIQSLDGLMEVYGLEPDAEAEFRQTVLEEFHYSPRPDAHGFVDGDRFDLGGVEIEAIHLPGHTRGHSGFRIDDVLFLADIDLTGFGPYYGDMWSSLDDFERSIAIVRELEADHYVTFHHKGVIESRGQFVELIDAFDAVIGRRHAAMLEFLSEPHTLDEMVAHRFVYRPHVESTIADSVERRTAQLHLQRMIDRGEVAADNDTYQRV